MKLTIGLGLAGLLALATTASAQSPIVAQPLAAGEVLLELNSVGVVTRRADRVTMTLSINVSGADEAEARRAVEQKLARVRAAVLAAGGEIDVGQVDTFESMGMNAMSANLGVGTAVEEEGGGYVGTATAEVTLRDVSRVDAVVNAIGGQAAIARGPEFTISDEAAARRAARADAITKARAEAEANAASAGMRVARMVRVSERVAPEQAEAINHAASVFQSAADADVETYVAPSVDFVLAPR